MRRSVFPVFALLFVACPGGGSDKESGVGIDTAAEAACAAAPAACDEDNDGFRPSEGDCDDEDSTINPGAEEVCDGLDNNCDGDIDEEVTTTYYTDADIDGFGDPATGVDACEQPAGYVANPDDCDDTQPRAYPGNAEVCDGIDNDCDSVVDNGVTTTYYADADRDGYGDGDVVTSACELPAGYVLDNTDCDDSASTSYPGHPEICDTLDNNCDGTVDEGVTTTYWADVDGDGYGDPALPDEACALPFGYSAFGTDCDDGDRAVNPGATEMCNRIDDDCDGLTDENDASDASTWYADADVDGYGDPTTATLGCLAPAGYVSDGTDCDDTRDLTNPGASEYCNGIDDDCDGSTDESDAVDASTWYADSDADGAGNPASTLASCSGPSGYVATGDDCDDADRSSFPGGIEVCDGRDNDCNGTIDDAPSDGDIYYADVDGDEFGDAGTAMAACSDPSGYVDNDYDCNDSNVSEPRVADAYSGSASGDGSASNPYLSIQDAIDDAWECVIALAGVYDESIDLGGKSIDVWGVEGSASTTIDAGLTTCDDSNPDECEAVVTIASGGGASPSIRGFTLSGGTGAATVSSSSETCADSSASHSGSNTCTVTTYNYCGGGVYVSGDDPSLEDLVITGNTLPEFSQTTSGDFEQIWMFSFGGGLCVDNGSVTADGVNVFENWADEGGGVYLSGGATLDYVHGIIAENQASDGGGVSIASSSLSATNAVIACNTATTDGGGVFGESTATLALENVSMFGNASSTSGSARGADVWMPGASTVWIINSIVQNDIATALLYGSSSATLQYNNVYNGSASGTNYGGTWSGGTGSMSIGGNFTSAACDGNPNNDDWSLLATSASIDGGNPDAGYNDADGTTNDAGAFGGAGGSW